MVWVGTKLFQQFYKTKQALKDIQPDIPPSSFHFGISQVSSQDFPIIITEALDLFSAKCVCSTFHCLLIHNHNESLYEGKRENNKVYVFSYIGLRETNNQDGGLLKTYNQIFLCRYLVVRFL